MKLDSLDRRLKDLERQQAGPVNSNCISMMRYMSLELRLFS